MMHHGHLLLFLHSQERKENERETEESIQGGTRVVEKSDLPNQQTWTW